uniref:Uncharacterized protein n=1 Tax=Anguilla anguilla TaxID=7936 RepID=A0A0E9UGW3_ANGAN
MLKQERAFPKLMGKHRTMKNSPRSRGVLDNFGHRAYVQASVAS